MAIKVNNLASYSITIDDCARGKCPKILINEEGNALVQGLTVDSSTKKELGIPEGEDVVFVPNSIIQKLIQHNK